MKHVFRWVVRPAIWSVALLVVGMTSHGQIVVPAETPDRAPLPVRLEVEIPDGAVIRGPGWIVPDGVQMALCSPSHGFLYAPPGSYTIRYEAWWYRIVRQEVTIVLADGSHKTISVIIDFLEGEIDASAAFSVAGGPIPPDPPDPPDPSPGGPYQIMLFFESDRLDNYPAKQRALLVSLALRDELRSKGHVFLEVLDFDAFQAGSVPARLKPWYDVVVGDPMPRICLAPKGGGPITDYPLPPGETELMELLE